MATTINYTNTPEGAANLQAALEHWAATVLEHLQRGDTITMCHQPLYRPVFTPESPTVPTDHVYIGEVVAVGIGCTHIEVKGS